MNSKVNVILVIAGFAVLALMMLLLRWISD
jgi:hypothetical protein